MFRAFSCPSSGATTTAVAASGLPSELGDSSAVAFSHCHVVNIYQARQIFDRSAYPSIISSTHFVMEGFTMFLHPQ
jgi:hypothetical protein